MHQLAASLQTNPDFNNIFGFSDSEHELEDEDDMVDDGDIDDNLSGCGSTLEYMDHGDHFDLEEIHEHELPNLHQTDDYNLNQATIPTQRNQTLLENQLDFDETMDLDPKANTDLKLEIEDHDMDPFKDHQF